MSRIGAVLTVALAVVTAPLLRAVRQDLQDLRGKEFQRQSFASPKGFRGLTIDGAPYQLEAEGAERRVGLFVLHRKDLAQEVSAWNDLQSTLAESKVQMVAICEDLGCAAELRRGLVDVRFTVLAAAAFYQASSLARMDAAREWMLCDGAGRVLSVLPIPKSPQEAFGLVEAVLREIGRDSNAKGRKKA
jgi:hypothetical protein